MKRSANLLEQVETNRQARALKLAERHAIEQQPHSRAEVAARLERRVRAAAEHGRDALRYDLVRLSTGDIGLAGLSAGAPVSARGVDIDLTAVLAAVLGPDALLAILLRDIDAIPEGLDPEAKVKHLAELAAEIAQLERQEERLVCEAEAQGIEILRRADADPRIVLEL